MQDRTVPFFPVLMEKLDTQVYPRHDLPQGYAFCAYEPGMEADWCRLVHEVGPVDSAAAARKIFEEEFLPYPGELRRRCLFVRDPQGEKVATASLWHGNHFGKTLQRVHWVMVSQKAQGKGLAKALLTRLLDIYNAEGFSGYLYLTSETWSYKAMNIYEKFGFLPYMGPKPAQWPCGDFEETAVQAWRIIHEKLALYNTHADPRDRTLSIAEPAPCPPRG